MQDVISEIEGKGVYFAPRPLTTVLGVKYLHLRGADGTDLYITEFGRPFARWLLPENHWVDDQWVKAHGIRLPGTSALYRLTTKEVDGQSKEIVIKWNRMGQDIPGETRSADAEAEFNSPFMEFSLVIELRNTLSPGALHAQTAGHLCSAQIRAGRKLAGDGTRSSSSRTMMRSPSTGTATMP
jgi:hypothetical protein